MNCCVCQQPIASVRESYGDIRYPLCLTCWHERPYEAPNSLMEPCPACQGTGEIECENCEGTGKCTCECGHRHDCGECDGDLYVRCEVCDGKKFIKKAEPALLPA